MPVVGELPQSALARGLRHRGGRAQSVSMKGHESGGARLLVTHARVPSATTGELGQRKDLRERSAQSG